MLSCANLRRQLVFSGNYSETATRDLNEDVMEEDAIAEHYDYDSDSDLEDAEDLMTTENSLNHSRTQDTARYLDLLLPILPF